MLGVRRVIGITGMDESCCTMSDTLFLNHMIYCSCAHDAVYSLSFALTSYVCSVMTLLLRTWNNGMIRMEANQLGIQQT